MSMQVTHSPSFSWHQPSRPSTRMVCSMLIFERTACSSRRLSSGLKDTTGMASGSTVMLRLPAPRTGGWRAPPLHSTLRMAESLRPVIQWKSDSFWVAGCVCVCVFVSSSTSPLNTEPSKPS